jgi:hypothetical protein
MTFTNAPVTIASIEAASQLQRHRLRIADDDGTTREVNGPQTDGSKGLPDILPHILIMRDLTVSLPYAGQDDARIRHVAVSMSGTARRSWDDAYAAIPDGADIVFDEVMATYVASYADPGGGDRYLQQEYVMKAKMDVSKYTVRQFRMLLQQCNEVIDLLPGEYPLPLDANAFKRAFYMAVPHNWRNDFIRAGKTHNLSIQELESYFTTLKTQVYANEKHNGNNKNTNGNNGDRKTKHTNNIATTNSNGNSNRIKRLKSNQTEKQTNDNSKVDSKVVLHTNVKHKDPCPNHPNGSHTYGECRLREKAEKALKASKSTTKKDSEEESHVIEVNNDTPTDISEGDCWASSVAATTNKRSKKKKVVL